MKKTKITGLVAMLGMLTGFVACGTDDGESAPSAGQGGGTTATTTTTTATVGGGGEGGQVQTVAITTSWFDAGTEAPVEGLTITIYAATDLSTPLGTATTGADGFAVVDATPSDAPWVAHASGDGFHDSWYFHDAAANQDSTWGNNIIASDALWGSIYGAAGVTPDPSAGVVAALVPPAAQVTADPAAGGIVVYVDESNTPDLSATEAESGGSALLLNAAAGDVTVSMTGPGGVAQRTLRAFPDALTLGHLRATGCDPIGQDCADPDASKCALYLVTGPAYFVCNEPLGSDGVGESCTRPNGHAGEDTCAAGLYCSYSGTPSPDERICHALCEGKGDCGVGEDCTAIRFDPAIGTCQPSCDPFDGASCQDAGTCLVTETVEGDTFAHCSHPGDLAVDEACDDTHGCAPGLMCAHMTNPNEPNLCRPVCDAEHPCSDGPCVVGSYGFGYCD